MASLPCLVFSGALWSQSKVRHVSHDTRPVVPSPMREERVGNNHVSLFKAKLARLVEVNTVASSLVNLWVRFVKSDVQVRPREDREATPRTALWWRTQGDTDEQRKTVRYAPQPVNVVFSPTSIIPAILERLPTGAARDRKGHLAHTRPFGLIPKDLGKECSER